MRRNVLSCLGVMLCFAACAGTGEPGPDDTGTTMDAAKDAAMDASNDAPTATGRLGGQVVRATSGTPLPGADLTLSMAPLADTTAHDARQVISGADGRFLFKDVVPGTWMLRVSRTGHRETSQSIVVATGADTSVEISLEPVAVDGDACITCHGDVDALRASLADDPPPEDPEAPEVLGECCGGSVPDIPAHEKVLLTMDFAGDTHHFGISCQDCHAGDPSGATRAQAHAGLVPDPTADGGGACRNCHPNRVAQARRSGHFTLSGKRHAVAVRAGVDGDLPEPLATAFDRHCNRCHATCGDCHVSVPGEAGGGLLKGHRFVKTPPDHLTCVGCHGTRIRDEYQGRNGGRPPDVHFEDHRMTCPDCHTGDQMHGPADGVDPASLAPRCEDCHVDDDAFFAVPAHGDAHRKKGRLTLSCQACHAIEYKQCFACHVALDDQGRRTHEVNAATNHLSPLKFRIGRNAEVDAMHPQTWVTVRHVPAAPGTFAYYGENLLPAFDAEPTWRRAAPHTIRRTTPRTDDPGGCGAGCHGNRDVFLGPNDIPDDEVDANAGVVVAVPPGPQNSPPAADRAQ